MMTIVLKKMAYSKDFGICKVDKSSRIISFVEKPETMAEGLINTGIYVLSPAFSNIFENNKVQDMIKEGKMDFGKNIIPYLLENNMPVYGYITNKLWFDVGTPERYLDAMTALLYSVSNKDIDAKRVDKNRRFFVQGTSTDSIIRKNMIIEAYATGNLRINGSALIGRHCYIGNSVYMQDATIDNFSIINDRVSIIKSSIMDRAFIGDGTRIENSIIGRHVSIGQNSKIINSVIADNVMAEENLDVLNSKIYPHKKLKAGTKISNIILQ